MASNTADDSVPNGEGVPCTTDGECNPGNDGSGMICDNNLCVPGCHHDNQCPGAQMCVAGQCSD